MKYETLELDLNEDTYFSLLCTFFDIKPELLADIKTQHTTFQEQVTHLVLSEAVSRAIKVAVKNEGM